MEKILISACLVGDNTRYDGGHNRVDLIDELMEFYELVPYCPEMEGGLGVPRDPAEIFMDQVRTQSGKDLTEVYNEAAKKAYSLCQFLGIRTAILKEKSPACGVHFIHNGRFDGRTVKGMGVTARYLKSKGIEVYSEDELATFLEGRRARAEKREAFIERQARYLEGQGAQKEEKPFRSTHNKDNRFESKDGERQERRPRFEGEHQERRPRFEGDRRPRFDKEGRAPRKEGETRSSDFSRDARFRRDDRKGGFKGKGNFKGKGGFKGKSSFRKDGPRKPFKKED